MNILKISLIIKYCYTNYQRAYEKIHFTIHYNNKGTFFKIRIKSISTIHDINILRVNFHNVIAITWFLASIIIFLNFS